MTLAHQSLVDLLEAFSAPAPTPGGGSAAALAGALGASLLAMVAAMTKTRSGTPENRAALDAARADLLRHRDALVALADFDAEAYDAVVRAYRLPAGTQEERAARTQGIRDAIRGATDVPLRTARTCAALAPLARAVAEHGNPAARSDVEVGWRLAMAGWSGGLANVHANLEQSGDPRYAETVRAELRRLRDAIDRDVGPASRALGVTERD